MRLGDLPSEQASRRLSHGRLHLRTGPFVLSIHTPLPLVAGAITTLYEDFPLVDDPAFADFHIDVVPRPGLRRWVRPQATFSVNGYFRTDPFYRPLAQAFFEWGLNACIARRAHQYPIVHAAVVERDGSAIALVGPSGAGKSTLCTALTIAGWRLLSDELALIVPDSRQVVPLARPISLKNDSIELVRTLDPAARFGPLTRTLRKGLIRHVRPPSSSVARMDEPAALKAFVFVRYKADSATEWTDVGRGVAFTDIAAQSMNYGLLGAKAFRHLSMLVDSCTCASLTYGRLSDAVASIDAMQLARAHA